MSVSSKPITHHKSKSASPSNASNNPPQLDKKLGSRFGRAARHFARTQFNSPAARAIATSAIKVLAGLVTIAGAVAVGRSLAPVFGAAAAGIGAGFAGAYTLSKAAKLVDGMMNSRSMP